MEHYPPSHVPLAGSFGWAMSVDVEEWYHTCFVPEYVDPRRRPDSLVEELDWLLPEILAQFADAGRRATFFVLGEVARRWPERIREVVAAGHELACHGDWHFRVADHGGEDGFRADLERARKTLEDVTGVVVEGYRAPEWSLRDWRNPLVRTVATAGFRWDASLTPCLGSGRRDNPRRPTRLVWHDGVELVVVPPLTFAGALRLPACGWAGRLVGARRLTKAAIGSAKRGELPLMTVHPWELSIKPTPGRLTGMAYLLHELGRQSFRPSFDSLLTSGPWRPIGEILQQEGTWRSE
ncbi:MAG: polysaccharide deacetylase family protein [Acidobacteriota bacterium]